MASGKPVVRQVAWVSMIPQVILMVALMCLFGTFVKPFSAAVNGALIFYLALSISVRYLVPHNHRKGMALFRAGNYAQAVEEFEKSYDFFKRHPWIDRYRFLVLLSSSRISYTEMALLNIAYGYAQSGDGKQAKEYYEKTLMEFPDSGMAKSALQMLEAGKKIGT